MRSWDLEAGKVKYSLGDVWVGMGLASGRGGGVCSCGLGGAAFSSLNHRLTYLQGFVLKYNLCILKNVKNVKCSVLY